MFLEAKISHQCLPILGEVDPLFSIFSDGTSIVLKNLGQILVERSALDQKSMFQQKDDHSGKQKAESRIELQLYCTSTQCHIQSLSTQRSSIYVLSEKNGGYLEWE